MNDDNDTKLPKPKTGGWNTAPDYTPQGPIWPFMVFTAFMIIAIGFMVFNHNSTTQADTVKLDAITSIYWSDADSGRINGSLKFRLNGIDAPETGGVGAAIGGSMCELERERGYEAKEWIVKFTRDVELSIAEEYGLDKYDRLVIDLSAAGVDVGSAGIAAGLLKPWPHKGRRALSKKPEWCN